LKKLWMVIVLFAEATIYRVIVHPFTIFKERNEKI